MRKNQNETSNSDERLTVQEWALAIVIAYETGYGLTDPAKTELSAAVAPDDFRIALRKQLVEAGYGGIFGI